MEPNAKLELKGRNEIILFLKIFAFGTRDGWWNTNPIPQEFSKAKLAEYLSENVRDRSCYNLFKKLTELGILLKTRDIGVSEFYRIDIKKYNAMVERLKKEDELFNYFFIMADWM